MSPEIGHLNELSLAVCAAVRLFSSVKSHVRLQMVIPSESLVTHFAFERLFSRVRPFVVLQDVFVAEGAIADFACEDLFSVARAVAVGEFSEISLLWGV